MLQRHVIMLHNAILSEKKEKFTMFQAQNFGQKKSLFFFGGKIFWRNRAVLCTKVYCFKETYFQKNRVKLC
jgi:hypothetical protein